MIPKVFSAEEAAFLTEYRALCERHGICTIVEVQGQLGLLNLGENRIWGCTAGQMVDKQIEAMSEMLSQVTEPSAESELRFAVGPV
jgi:hypothetical protein